MTEIPYGQEQTVYDECFTVSQSKWGTWSSHSVQDSDTKEKLVTSLSKDSCIQATRYHLKSRQDMSSSLTGVYFGHVEGKL